jgi:hypothetical protein
VIIASPDPYYIQEYQTQIIASPTSEYELPIVLIDPRSITPQHEELLSTLAEYAPRTRFKRGDLAMLRGEVPKKVAMVQDRIPRVWEVRFVVSKWAMEAMLTLHSRLDVNGADHLRAMIESHGGLPEYQYEQPVIYAHGYPHGMYPNTAAWLGEWNLKRLVLRDPIVAWRNVVEEAGASFYGYDSNGLTQPFHFEVAPDDYSHGSNLGRPFLHEEPNVESLCISGLEEYLFDPIVLGQRRRMKKIDRDHDIFVR